MSETRNDEMTLRDLLELLWGYRWLVLATTILGGLIGTLYSRVIPSVYQVDALMQVEDKDGSAKINPLGSMADAFDMKNPAETEIEILKSRMVLERAIAARHMDLVASPVKYGIVSRLLRRPVPKLVLDSLECPPVPVNASIDEMVVLKVRDSGHFSLYQGTRELVRGRIGELVHSGGTQLRVQSIAAPAGQCFFLFQVPSLAATAALRGRLGVQEVGKKTGVIQQTLTGDDPEEAAQDLNAIAQAYVEQNVERKSAEAEKTLEFLRDQLPDLKKKLEESEQKLNSYRSRMGSIDLDAQAQEMLQQQVEVQQKLVDLQQKRKEEQAYFKAAHPNMRTLDSVQGIYQAKAAQQERQLKSLPLQQQEIIRLTRDVQVNTDLYTGLLYNAQQLQVVKAGEIGNVRLIDAAEPTFVPVKPNRKVIALAGFALGFALGAGIALGKRMLFHGVEDPKEIEKDFNLPVYAMVPHSAAQARLRTATQRREPGIHVLAHAYPEDVVVESVRSLRTSLQFALVDASNCILSVTGPSPNIGKSFVCQNAAVVMAQAGLKVLLVDGDMRRGHLHQAFGLERGSGLADILAGSTSWQEQLRVPIDGLSLSFLTSGNRPPNPSELLHLLRAQQLFQDLAGVFDVVLVDAPPILAVTDAAILGSYAGATLLVLKAGAHATGEIDAALSRLRQAGVEPKGAVMNDMVRSRSRGYGYGYGYGYSYQRDNKS